MLRIQKSMPLVAAKNLQPVLLLLELYALPLNALALLLPLLLEPFALPLNALALLLPLLLEAFALLLPPLALLEL